MTKEEIIAWSVGGILTLVEFSPLKVNPWTAVFKGLKWLWVAFCRALNAEVLGQLKEISDYQHATREKLENHIKMDDEREADKVRERILRFNNELLRDVPHTEEEFVEILYKIDWYKDFCKTHENYSNSRSVHAIANIERVYDERLAKHDFL